MMNVLRRVGHKKQRKSRKRKPDEWEEELCNKGRENQTKGEKQDFPKEDKWLVL